MNTMIMSKKVFGKTSLIFLIYYEHAAKYCQYSLYRCNITTFNLFTSIQLQLTGKCHLFVSFSNRVVQIVLLGAIDL